MTKLNVKEQTTREYGLMKKIKKPLKSSSPKSEGNLLIDYPTEGEKIQEGSYAIRISTDPNSEVEISINNGEWRPCRESIGYWWFDWKPMNVARCKLAARSRVGKGRWKKSDARSCEIIDSNQPLNIGLTFN